MEQYWIWVNWAMEIVSFHQVKGFEALPFASEESRRANITILLSEGFRFQ